MQLVPTVWRRPLREPHRRLAVRAQGDDSTTFGVNTSLHVGQAASIAAAEAAAGVVHWTRGMSAVADKCGALAW